jgi:hypothetical protein
MGLCHFPPALSRQGGKVPQEVGGVFWQEPIRQGGSSVKISTERLDLKSPPSQGIEQFLKGLGRQRGQFQRNGKKEALDSPIVILLELAANRLETDAVTRRVLIEQDQALGCLKEPVVFIETTDVTPFLGV